MNTGATERFMAEIHLTPSQQRALDLTKSMSVTAGAGSGKTGVLVMRYVKTLAENRTAGVRNVLAITFTEKAAAEMKARVRDDVENLIAAGGDDAPRWREILDTLDCAAISTIHSFCLGLLREHPIEAAVDPLFETLDEPHSRRLRAQAVEEALQAANDDPALAEHARILLRFWNRRSIDQNIDDIFNAGHTVDHWMRFYGESTIEQINQHIVHVVKTIWLDKARAVFNKENILALASFECANPSDKLELIRTQVLGALQEGVDDPTYDTLGGLLPVLLSIDLRLGSAKAWGDGFAGCKELLKDIREQAKSLEQTRIGAHDWAATPVLKAFAAIYLHARELYDDAKGRGRALDFDDLQTLALLLLTDRPEIRRTVHERFVAVLVDEFQDTNHLQWEIIRRVVQRDDDQGSIPPGGLFIVGDPKQSIYGFREAEIRVFGEITERCIEPDARVEMDDNFRSAPAPVAFVNKLMTNLMGITMQPFDPAYRKLVCHRPAEFPGSVTLLLPSRDANDTDNNNDGESEDVSQAESLQEADLLARQILSAMQNRWQVWDKRLKQLRPAEFRDVAILLRSRTHQGAYEEALRSVGIPFNVLGGFGLYQRQEVLDIANVLRFLLHRKDDIALAALLRSPMAGLSDDALYRIARTAGTSLWDRLQAAGESEMGADAEPLHRIRTSLHTWMRWSRRMPVAELLEHILVQTGAWGSMVGGERGEQTPANIQKIIGLARGASDLADFVAQLDEQIETATTEGEAQIELEQSNAVKIMTIHAAKGLEFPIVCLADTAFRRPPSFPDACFHREWGIGIKVRDSAGQMQETAMRRFICERLLAEEEAENTRLLYVAATRARDHLVISGSLPAKKKSWLTKILSQMKIDPDAPADIPEALVHEDAARIPIEPLPPAPALDDMLGRFRQAEDAIRANDRSQESGVGRQESGDRSHESESGNASQLPPTIPSPHLPISLQPLPLQQHLPVFSPTALERYLLCPYSYFLTDVLGVPHTGFMADEMPAPALIFTEPKREGPPGIGLTVGIVAHRLFEEIHTIAAGEERAAILRYLKEEEISDAREQERIVDLVTGMLASFRASDFGRRILGSPEAYAELPFFVPVGPGVLSGKIDLLYRDDGQWKIVDYKTDDITPADLPARCERYRPQLQAYSLATGKLLNCDPPEACLYFTRLGRRVPIVMSSDEAAAFEQRLSDAIRRILDRDFEPIGTCRDSCAFSGSEYCTGISRCLAP